MAELPKTAELSRIYEVLSVAHNLNNLVEQLFALLYGEAVTSEVDDSDENISKGVLADLVDASISLERRCFTSIQDIETIIKSFQK